mmetsp:Transcript_48732/g.146852  ORF Transcript_48732/g.146852 Transcript_48732/m.146852 type:complete len:87 (+) Transcript_48732:376-636(+)
MFRTQNIAFVTTIAKEIINSFPFCYAGTATFHPEVKIRPEHTSDGDTPAHETTSMEPITKETGTKIGSKPEVVVTSSKGSEEGANR